MSSDTGFIVLSSGECFEGRFWGGEDRFGEVVFNTSHSGYEEMATDPSYYNQILVATASMQGNYGVSDEAWESRQFWINGFVCLELQNSEGNSSWREKLNNHKVPILSEVDTRELVLLLRERGTTWGGIVRAADKEEALAKMRNGVSKLQEQERDWAMMTSTKESYELEGQVKNGIRVAVLDLGSKRNIVNEIARRCETVKVFPSRTSAEDIKAFEPHGVMLSNGPGDPMDVEVAVDTVKSLLGWRFVFGICMGHQILSRALGAKTYKLKFGHRGSNHPIRDDLLNRVYMTSQNHGYAVDPDSLPTDVEVTHTNLNDNTVSGIRSVDKKCMSVQFHPESNPGPNDSRKLLFDYFMGQIQ